MKMPLFSVMVFLLAFISSGYSVEMIESYKLDHQELPKEINLGELSVTAHGKQFSISEWWIDQPNVTVEYEGEGSFRSEIEAILQSLGFVLGNGKRLYVKTERIQDRFLYIETAYNAKEKNNRDSLLIITEDNYSQLHQFFLDVYGNFHRHLPKLILIHTDRFFQVNGTILYKGPEYTVVQTFEEKLKIILENQVIEINVPFYPILFLDMSQSQHLLTVETDREQQIVINGEKYTAPIQLFLNEGVHE